MFVGMHARLRVRTWDSDRAVIRAMRRRTFAKSAWAREFRVERHRIIREVLAVHHADQDLCIQFRL
jgi:hypothetical protein